MNFCFVHTPPTSIYLRSTPITNFICTLYRVFGCEITSRDMHKLVVFFKETAVFEGMK